MGAERGKGELDPTRNVLVHVSEMACLISIPLPSLLSCSSTKGLSLPLSSTEGSKWSGGDDILNDVCHVGRNTGREGANGSQANVSHSLKRDRRGGERWSV